MTDTVADQLVAAWSALAADTSALGDAPPLDQPGGRDWAAVLLVERNRAGIGAAVVEILQRELPLTVAGLCVRDIIRACNEAYAVIATRAAAAAAAGEQFEVAAAVAETEPFLRERISRAAERARRRA